MAAKHCCGHIADLHLFLYLSFWLPSLAESQGCCAIPGRQLLERDEAVLCAEVAPAASLLMRLEIGERHDGEEWYFEEPTLKLKPFQGYPG